MTRNPEFVRNLWLIHRPIWLALSPLMLGGIFLAMFALNDAGGVERIGAHQRWETLAFGLFAMVTIVFGASNVFGTIAIELKDQTWDGQRMSAIPPWSMAWGKLFGSTALAWYGGFVCIALYATAAHSQSIPLADIVRNISVWILAGIIAQAALLLAALVSLLKAPMAKREQGAAIAASIMIVPGYFIVPTLWIVLQPELGITWFGWWIGALNLLILSAAAFAAWAIVGVYFAMRREFQYANGPLPWLAFAIFCVVYVAGFERGYGDPLPLLSGGRRTLDGLATLYVSVVLLYVIALAEPLSWQTVRRVGRSFEGRLWKEVLNDTPRAISTLVLLAVVVCWLIVAGDASRWPVFFGRQVTDEVLVAVLLFAARDVGLIILLSIAPSSKNSDVMAIGCLLVLNGVLPVTAHQIADPLLPLFWPVPTGSILTTIGPALLQVAAVYFVLARRVRGIHLEKL